MKSSFLLNLLLLVLATTCLAQTETKYANYVPPSPNVATIQQYGDYPVSGATGLPTINVPLFTVDLNRYSLPITLNYHASGRKTALNFSSLGLGWSLDVTPVISRTVRGRADMLPFQKAPYAIAEISSLSSDYDKVQSMTSEYAYATPQTPNSQYDLFTYTLNGKSGKFIIREGVPVMLTGEPIKVRPISESYFELTDDDGVVYLFGSQPGDNYGGVEFYNHKGVDYNDSWFINTITTPYNEQIKFRYGGVYSTSATNSRVWGNMSLFDQYEAQDAIYNANNIITLTERIRSFQEYFMSYVTEIEFPSGKIVFAYDTDYRTTGATLTDHSGNAVRKYVFGYTQIPGENLPNNNSMLLSALSLTGPQGTIRQKYSFDYDLSAGFQITWDFPKQRDWWGYYNGNSGANGSNIPEFRVPMVTSGGGMQTIGDPGGLAASFAHKSYGMLRKITFPTGGTTQFVYEPNRYLDLHGVLQQGPGIRVQQVLSADGSGNLKRKLYKYGKNESGAGELLYQPRKYDFATELTTAPVPELGIDRPIGNGGVSGAMRIRRYRSVPNPEVAEAYSYPVYYSHVTEYDATGSGNSIHGKTEFIYSIPRLDLNQLTMPPWGQHESSFIYQPVYLPPYTGSRLITKRTYKSQGTAMVLQSVDSTAYATFKAVSIPEIFLAQSVFVHPDEPSKRYERILAQSPNYVPVYVYRDVLLKGGVSLKTAERHTVYENGQVLSTATDYTYNNLDHLYPSVIRTAGSDGKIKETRASYPLDFHGISATDPVSSGVKNLQQKHVYTPVIETSSFSSNSDGGNRQMVRSEFNAYKADQPLPDKIYRVENATPLSNFTTSLVTNGAVKIDPGYKVAMQFNKYNSQGRILEQEAPGNVKESYLWGYKNSYPVAKIIGADHAGASQLVNLVTLDNPPTDNAVRTEIAKVRSGLSGTLVNGFTYAPLVGMTSQTDERGQPTYYGYDDIGRLSVIKDQDSQILRSFAYNMKNAAFAGTDLVVYKSAALSLPYTKSDCPSGKEGTTVRYEIPAGMFVSTVSAADAQQQAEAAAALYGPLYANLMGECKDPGCRVNLNFSIMSPSPAPAITVKFMQGSTTVATASFPTSPSGPRIVNLPVGTYYLTVTIPPAYQDKNLRLTVAETGQSWYSGGTLGINSDMINLSTQGGIYNITIAN